MQCKLNVSLGLAESIVCCYTPEVTTFQALIDAFLQALTHLLPLSESTPDALFQILQWPLTSPEIICLVTLMGSLAFLIFFRFDWLGMISAFLKSMLKPLSLKPAERTLDQNTLIFLILIFLPSALLRHFVAPNLVEYEMVLHPFVLAACSALLAFGFHFAAGWNKRIHGLNHLKLSDGVLIGFLTLLRFHPAFPYIALLWLGFALLNYSYEAVFKYSMLALGLGLFWESTSLVHELGLKAVFDGVGKLNSVAIIFVSFTVFWMGLESLQKSLSENTFRTFKWLNLLLAVFFASLYFLRA